MNQQTNLNDVYEFTRGEINTIVNGLAKAPAESVFQILNQLLSRLQGEPSKLGTTTEVVSNSAQSSEVVQ